MLDDCNYNKIRLLHDVSRIVWYLEHHAKKDAKESGHELCHAMCVELQADLEKHMEKLKEAIVGISKEDKFQ